MMPYSRSFHVTSNTQPFLCKICSLLTDIAIHWYNARSKIKHAEVRNRYLGVGLDRCGREAIPRSFGGQAPAITVRVYSPTSEHVRCTVNIRHRNTYT